MDTITDNAAKNRYEMTIDGHTVFTTYSRTGNTVHLLHVEAPPALRGTGAAGRFMQALMDKLRTDGLKARPVCSYAVSWIARHKGVQDLVV